VAEAGRVGSGLEGSSGLTMLWAGDGTEKKGML